MILFLFFSFSLLLFFSFHPTPHHPPWHGCCVFIHTHGSSTLSARYKQVHGRTTIPLLRLQSPTKKMFNASQLQRLEVQPFSFLRGNSFLVSDKSLLQLVQASRFVGVLTITSTTTQRYSVLLLLSQRLHTSLNHKRVNTANKPAATDVVWLCQHFYTTYVPSPKQQNTTRPKVEIMVEEQNHIKHSTSSTLSYTGDKSNIFIQSSCT